VRHGRWQWGWWLQGRPLLVGAAGILAVGLAVAALHPAPVGDGSWDDDPGPVDLAGHADERAAMVATQLERPTDGRVPIVDERVLAAMRAVPRHAFVPRALRSRAYDDSPLPIGHGQTISQPFVVAWMTELLGIAPGARVLEVGTGSGYQAAVLAAMGARVYSVEILVPLHARSRRILEASGVTCRSGDGYHGWPEEAPFDGILVTCAAGHLPPALFEQLAPTGRIVIPIGGSGEVQRLVVITKSATGERCSKTVGSVRFVPLVRGPGS